MRLLACALLTVLLPFTQAALQIYESPQHGVRIRYDDSEWQVSHTHDARRDVVNLDHKTIPDAQVFLTLFTPQTYADKGARQMWEVDIPWFEDIYGKMTNLSAEMVDFAGARAHRAEFDTTDAHVLRYTLIRDGYLTLLGFTCRVADATAVRRDFAPIQKSFQYVPRKPALEETEPWRQTVAYHLPITGTWYVTWGGAQEEQNIFHRKIANQRYAYDLVVHDRRGREYRRDGTRNEDYLAFGRPVVAAADGVVVEAADGVHDCTPGLQNITQALGNFVVIRHAGREYSVTGHLRQGSVCVKPGERVRQGEKIGECGNAGNSSAPHIHFHVMDRPEIELGLGQRVLFSDVTLVRNGKRTTEKLGEPVRGDLVSHER